MTIEISSTLTEKDAALLGSDDNPEKSSLVEKLFKSLDSEDMDSLLGGYCTSETRETFSGLEWVESVEWNTPTSGSIRVIFSGHAFHGCRDMHGNYEYDQSLSFEVDLKEQTIQFVSKPPELQERDTVDEF
jgi:hypothetical protein